MKTLLAKIRQFEGYLLGSLLIVMALLYVFNIAVRELATQYAANFDWIEDASRFVLAWVVFLGLGMTFDRNRHIAMGALLGRLRGNFKKCTSIIIDLTGTVFCLFVAIAGYKLTMYVLNSGQTSPTLGISMAWLYAPLPIGFASLALRYAVNMFGFTARHNSDLTKEAN